MIPSEEYERLKTEMDQQEYEAVSEEYQRYAQRMLATYVGAQWTPALLWGLQSECRYLASHLTGMSGQEYEVFLYINEDSHAVSIGFRKKPFKDPELTLPRLQGFTRLLPEYDKVEEPVRLYDEEIHEDDQDD